MSTISDAISPYLLWIKLAAIVLVLSLLIGLSYYIRKIFIERDMLLTEKGKLQTEIALEKQRTTIAMEQLELWQDTVKKMNAAVRNIKIQSDTYIQGVENEKPPVVPPGSSIPFIVPGVPSVSPTSGYENITPGRVRSVTS